MHSVSPYGMIRAPLSFIVRRHFSLYFSLKVMLKVISFVQLGKLQGHQVA